MNKFLNTIAYLLLLIFNTSFSTPESIVMITDTYNIVSPEDIQEEEEKCFDPQPFPPREFGGCQNYWQCLPTQEVFMSCEDIGDIGDYNHTGQIDFWIKDGNNIHHYLTRRNFDIESCFDWIDEWKAVMSNEDIVCLSGDFIDTDNNDAQSSSPLGTHHYWIIDRMKSRHGEWSYFLRGKELEEELRLVEERRRQRELEELELSTENDNMGR